MLHDAFVFARGSDDSPICSSRWGKQCKWGSRTTRGEVVGDDDLGFAINGGLRSITLDVAILGLQDAAFRIGKTALRRPVGLIFWRLRRLAVLFASLSLALFLGLGLQAALFLRRSFGLGFKRGFALFHALIAHCFVFRCVRFDLRAVQRDMAKLDETIRLDVQSRGELVWRCLEPGWVFCPGVDDGFEGRSAPEAFEALGEIVRADEGCDVTAQLVVGLVMESAHRGFLDGSVHALDLAVRPRMIGFGALVFDVVLRAGPFKGMDAELQLPGGQRRLDQRRGEKPRRRQDRRRQYNTHVILPLAQITQRPRNWLR